MARKVPAQYISTPLTQLRYLKFQRLARYICRGHVSNLRKEYITATPELLAWKFPPATRSQFEPRVTMATIQELGERIARNSALVNKWLASKKCKTPSFDRDADQEFPSTADSLEIEAARLAIIDDTSALHDLTIGPGEVLRRLCWGVSHLYFTNNYK